MMVIWMNVKHKVRYEETSRHGATLQFDDCSIASVMTARNVAKLAIQGAKSNSPHLRLSPLSSKKIGIEPHSK
jgi:hypothetical protein